MSTQKFKSVLGSLADTIVLLGSVSVLTLFFLVTSPSETSFVVSFLPLFLVWVVAYTACMQVKFFIRRINLALLRLIASTFATVVMLMLMFSALGDLGVFDIGLLLTLATTSVFYFRRTWSN